MTDKPLQAASPDALSIRSSVEDASDPGLEESGVLREIEMEEGQGNNDFVPSKQKGFQINTNAKDPLLGK